VPIHPLPAGLYPQVWDILNDPQHRKEILKNTDQDFPGLESLDPARMSASEIFFAVNIIRNAQDSGKSILTFRRDLHSILHDLLAGVDIVELDDPSPTRNAASGPPSRPTVPDFSPKELTPQTIISPNPSSTTLYAKAVVSESIASLSPNALTPRGRKRKIEREGHQPAVPVSKKHNRVTVVTVPPRASSR
jgi:hypothetical protein